MGFTLYLLLQQRNAPAIEAVLEQMLQFESLNPKFIISGLRLRMG